VPPQGSENRGRSNKEANYEHRRLSPRPDRRSFSPSKRTGNGSDRYLYNQDPQPFNNSQGDGYGAYQNRRSGSRDRTNSAQLRYYSYSQPENGAMAELTRTVAEPVKQVNEDRAQRVTEKANLANMAVEIKQLSTEKRF
jgi:hypothetical protein